METVINQVKNLASAADEATRKKLIDSLRDLSYSLESAVDKIQRVMYTHLQISSIRVGIDLKLFNLLADSTTPLTVEHLQQKTGTAPVLLARLLRYLSSVRMIKEVEKGTFTSTNVTEALAIPGNQSGVHHQFETCGPIYQEMPTFLANTKYQDITDNANTVHQAAFKTDLPAFLWFAQDQPQLGTYLNEYMAHRRKGMNTWLSVYPVEHETKGWSSRCSLTLGATSAINVPSSKLNTLTFLDELFCRTCLSPSAKHWQRQGSRILFMTSSHQNPFKGLISTTCVLFWPDEKCRIILQNIISAMGKESVILLDEMVLSDTDVHWHTTQIDMTMMGALASIERTQTQWASLLDSVGLKITNTYTYTPSIYESVS